jgi:hypothetical protein
LKYLKGDLDMAIDWKKQREHQNVSTDIMDRFVDGKIIDRAEMHDRALLFQQLGIILTVPKKRNHQNRI